MGKTQLIKIPQERGWGWGDLWLTNGSDDCDGEEDGAGDVPVGLWRRVVGDQHALVVRLDDILYEQLQLLVRDAREVSWKHKHAH